MAQLREPGLVATGSAADFIPPKPHAVTAPPGSAGLSGMSPMGQRNADSVTRQRGKPVSSDWAEAVIATVHPSAVLRARDADRERARDEFFQDMRSVAAYLQGKAKVAGSQ